MSDDTERSVASAGSVKGEPVAWGIACDNRLLASYTCEDEQSAREMAGRFEASRAITVTVVPLYRSPTLTDAEREAVAYFSQWCIGPSNRLERYAATLRGLLERLW